MPFATTEGTLVTTYQYGMRAITEAGGANAYVLADALDITPCFVVGTTREALALASWLDDHLPDLQALAVETTAHGRLVEIRPHVFGRRVFAQFVFSTGDAMGLNMVNVAVDRISRQIAEAVPCERWYLRCNYSSDKKPAAINLFRPYGKEVAIDLTLPAAVVEAHLGVSPAALVEFAASGRLGTMQAGALGANAHFANGLAAIYIACGQDVAQIVNASIGFLDVELVGEDDLYVAARLPNLVVGTVGVGPAPDPARVPGAARLRRRRVGAEVRRDRGGHPRRRRARDLRGPGRWSLHRGAPAESADRHRSSIGAGANSGQRQARHRRPQVAGRPG